MKSWKEVVEDSLAEAYKGVTIKWNGDDPTLVIPNELIHKQAEIVEYTEAIWFAYGGEVEFNQKLAVSLGEN